MPHHHAAALVSGRSAVILGRALRTLDRVISDPVDLDALRQALETEMAKRSYTPFDLMRVGLHWAIDRIGRAGSKDSR